MRTERRKLLGLRLEFLTFSAKAIASELYWLFDRKIHFHWDTAPARSRLGFRAAIRAQRTGGKTAGATKRNKSPAVTFM